MKEEQKEIASKLYDDLVEPTAKPIGKIFSFLPRTIRLWFSKWETWIINGEKSLELTAQAIRNKTKNISIENLTEPEPYVAVPAIQQLTYSFDSSELREMYANLLVSSMNKETKYFVHPSFVEIIKQLSPDEAKLLKYLASNPVQPLIDVRLVLKQNEGFILLNHNFTNIAEGICDNPNGIYSYIDNLERLKLIEIPFDEYLKNDKLYEALEKHPTIVKLKEDDYGEKFKEVKIVKKKFVLTSYAEDFIKICL